MIAAGQQRMVDGLVDSFKRSKSPDDKEYAEENFRQDVVNIMNSEGTLSHKAWTAAEQCVAATI